MVPLPLFPLVLQRRFLSDRSVTGLLLGTGLMFWNRPPLAPLAVRVWKMSLGLLADVSSYTAVYPTVSLSNLSESRKGYSGNGEALHD